MLFYSTFFFFFFIAELLDTWLWRWVAFLIVFGIMVVVTAVLALFGYLKVRRIRGPQKTIETVKEIPDALTPGHDRSKALSASDRGQPDRGSVRQWPTRSVGGSHRRSMAPSRGACQRHSLSRGGSRDRRRNSRTGDRPLVILLHGFGSFWWSWRHQLRLRNARRRGGPARVRR